MELLENETELVKKLCKRLLLEGDKKQNTRLSILDIGCGTGKLAIHLNEVTGGKVTAIDPVHERIATAKQKAHTNEVAFEVQSADKLNFADETFDVVVSLKALHEMTNLWDTLQESLRVLKAGGKIFVIDWIGGVTRTRSHSNAKKYFAIESKAHATKYFTMKRLEDELSKAGFAEVRVEANKECELMLAEGDKT